MQPVFSSWFQLVRAGSGSRFANPRIDRPHDLARPVIRAGGIDLWIRLEEVPMYDSMLVPTDGSQEMAEVLDEAIELASISEVTLHVLHVIDDRAYHSVPDEAREQVRDTLREDAESFTKSAAEKALEAGLEVVREIRWGDPAPAILSYATENAVDLVVMGTHGRTGYERYLLGSVAEKVVRMAPMPVLTVAVGDTDAQRQEILNASAAETSAPVGSQTDPEADDRQATDSEETRHR